MIFKKFKFLLFVVFIFSSFSIFSFAHDSGKKGVCKEDLEKFCAEKQKNQEEKIKCLKKHKSELNPNCLTKVEEVKEKMKSFKKDCKKDIKKFCDEVASEHLARKNCLKQHESEVSPECKPYLQRKQEGGEKTKSN